MNKKGAKQQLEAEKMSAGSPEICPKLNELSEPEKEVSLFDPDTKDSGFCEDVLEENEKPVGSPLGLEDSEATILCFSPQLVALDATPNKLLLSGKKKRLFLSPDESPSVIAANSLKRLKLFELDYKNITVNEFDDYHLDFSDEILKESSDDEVSNLPPVEVPNVEIPSDDDKKDLVKEAVERSTEEDLIGDYSKSYALPVIVGFHSDLRSISVDTMKDLLEGKFQDVVNSVRIIDSRYPYEFQGGHIKGAVNIYTTEDCHKLLFEPSHSKNERHILIFHCEFSKERGPNMIRNLRQADRAQNTMNYPALTYPEVYVLEGGYKKFFEKYPQHCDPMKYKQMLHPEHGDEMLFFRKQSKTSDNILKTSKKRPPVSRMVKPVRKFLSNDFF